MCRVPGIRGRQDEARRETQVESPKSSPWISLHFVNQDYTPLFREHHRNPKDGSFGFRPWSTLSV